VFLIMSATVNYNHLIGDSHAWVQTVLFNKAEMASSQVPHDMNDTINPGNDTQATISSPLSCRVHFNNADHISMSV